MPSFYTGFRSARRGFEYAAEDELRTIGNASGNTARDSIDSATGLGYSAKTGAVLKAFAGIDTEDSERKVRL